MDSNLQREITRLKNLKGTSDLPDTDIERNAKVNLIVRDFKANPIFLDPKEQNLAEERFRSYLVAHEIESVSEIDTLKSLIFNEIFETRIQNELNKLHKDGKLPSDRMTDQLTNVQNQKLELKVKLGIDSEEKAVSELTGLQILKDRCEKYINAHKNEFTITAPDGTLLLLRRKVKDFDTMKHPWFAGRWLFNYEILKDVKDGKLSKSDAWRYLCASGQGGEYKPSNDKKYSEDYVTYCLDHWAEITSFLENK